MCPLALIRFHTVIHRLSLIPLYRAPRWPLHGRRDLIQQQAARRSLHHTPCPVFALNTPPAGGGRGRAASATAARCVTATRSRDAHTHFGRRATQKGRSGIIRSHYHSPTQRTRGCTAHRLAAIPARHRCARVVLYTSFPSCTRSPCPCVDLCRAEIDCKALPRAATIQLTGVELGGLSGGR